MKGEVETMRCEQCGAEITKGETFCHVCGARVNSTAGEKKPAADNKPTSEKKPASGERKTEKTETKKQSNGTKKLLPVALIGIIIAFAAVALTIVLAKMGRSTVMERDSDRPFLVVTETNAGKQKLAVFGDGVRFADSEEGGRYAESSWNGTSALVDEKGRLHVMTSGGVEVADVSVYSAYVSPDGSFVAYLKNFSGDAGELYIYNVEKKTKAAVDNGVLDGVVLSPNGATVCYTAYDEASDAHHVRMSKSQKKGERVLDCESVLAVSNDGSRMFFTNTGKVYEMMDGSRTRICEMDAIDAGMGVWFNADCTEMLYQMSYGDAEQHIFTEGEEQSIPWVSFFKSEPVVVKEDVGSSQSNVLRVKSFQDSVFWGEWAVVKSGVPLEHFHGNESVDVICSADEKKFAVITEKWQGGSFRLEKITDKGDRRIERECGFDLEAKPVKLYGDAKLDNVYFTNERGELWHIKNKKLNMVSADVSMVAMSESGELYFMYDGVVLCRANGSERVSIERNTNVKTIEPAPNGIVVVSGAREYYREGKKVEWIDWRVKERVAK